jgi:hypothetical protein
MRRIPTPAAALAARLCRPQRVGVFGHRGVGKTTLLTMLYREAVAGRLPDLRLAAADARTANYLSDKILQLESGQALPATLAETDLRFHLYHRNVRLELLVKDYQGEHVELGRTEPIGDFLRNCDAAWLCLDAAAADRLRRQQEVEQLVEQYLAVEPQRVMDRPMALVLTKADLLGPEAADLQGLAGSHFAMVRHALQSHCPHNGLFAVSSLGARRADTSGPTPLEPQNLREPLLWLASTLQAQDEARMEQLWAPGGNVALLERCLACFVRRYPDAPAAAQYRGRLSELRWRQRRRRGLVAAATVACLVAGTWTYDALGYQSAARFERARASDPAAILDHWHGYQTWHPTRNLFHSGAAAAEAQHLGDLAREVHEHQCQGALADLRRRAADPDADPEQVWQQFQAFHSAYPEADVEGELQQLRAAVKTRRDAQLAQRAQRSYDELVAAEGQAPDLLTLVDEADRFLRDYAGTPHEEDVRRRRDTYLTRIDDHDIEFARNYSARQPLNFQTRRETYQHYLDKHPTGAFADEARTAVAAIDADWDKVDFRAVRDQFLAHPGDIPDVVARCRTYLAVHPTGKFADCAQELLRWTEKVTAPHEYRVVLRSGDFEHKVARWFSGGPSLSVELEVAGARYGPSHYVAKRYDPDWDYEFPRPIRWKLGDPVRVRVIDNTWGQRVVAEFAAPDGDPLALRLLTGDAWSGKNRLTFACDFSMPSLPKIE